MKAIEIERNRRAVQKTKFEIIIKEMAESRGKRVAKKLCEQLGVNYRRFVSWKSRNCHLEAGVWVVDQGENRFHLKGTYRR